MNGGQMKKEAFKGLFYSQVINNVLNVCYLFLFMSCFSVLKT